MNNVISTELLIDVLGGSQHNPRKEFEPTQLSELAASINQHGVLQPTHVLGCSSPDQ